MTADHDESMRPSLFSRAAARRCFSAQHPRRRLRLLIVDGYAQKSRDEFASAGLPLASSLYTDMLVREVPRGVELEFDTVFPCSDAYAAPSDEELSCYDGAAFTGSSYSAYAPDEDVLRQVELMRRTFEQGVSSFGSCWGIQIAAVALGGEVELSPLGREVGVGHKIALTPEGRGHPMFTGKKPVFSAFMSHSDEVTRLPQGAVVTAGNEHSRVQAMAVTHTGTESWFVQYHPEYNLDYYARLIANRKERMVSMGFFQSADEIETYVEDFKALHRDKSRKDVRWKYGIDEDLTEEVVRCCEVRNWLKYLVQMGKGAR